MPTIPDDERRLRLRVALKLMALVAAVAAAGVTLAYLAGGPDRRAPAAPVRIALGDLAPGQARTVLWDGRPVIIVHRRAATRGHLAGDAAADAVARWLVAFAADPARGCPVRWLPGSGELRSTCGDARFDAAGRPLGDAAAPLAVPPHRITADGVLVLGER